MKAALVSLCNLPSSRFSGLVFVELETGAKRLVNLGMKVPVAGCTGLAKDERRVYALLRVGQGEFFVAALERRSLHPVFVQKVPEVVDGHSILSHKGHLYVASTGTDSVLRYTIQDEQLASPFTLWAASESASDTHHLNSLAIWNGDLIVSAFGQKLGAEWSTAKDGYLYDITEKTVLMRGLQHPHSLCAFNGNLFFCESSKGALASLDGRNWPLKGYVRGLGFVENGRALIGTSFDRRVSKSRGVLNHPAEPAMHSGRCVLTMFDLKRRSAEREVDLGAYGTEIYDVSVWEGVNSDQLAEPLPLERELENIQAQFDQQNLWVTLLKGEVEVRDVVILELHKQASRLQKEVDNQTGWARGNAEQVSKRDEIIADLQNTVRELAEWAQTSAAAVARRDAIIPDLQATVARQTAWAEQLTHQVQSLVAQVVERQQTVESLTAQLAESNQKAQSLAHQVIEKEHAIQTLSGPVGEKGQSLQSRTKQLTGTRDAVQALTALVGEQQLALNAIYSSRLWKLRTTYRALSEPLRAQLRRLATSRPPHWLTAVRARQRTAHTTLPAPLPPAIVPTRKLDVICFPEWDWNSHHQYPRQLMTQFARGGHRVFYLSPHFADGARREVQVRALSDRVYELRLSGTNTISEGDLTGAIQDQSLGALCAFIRQQNIAEAVCWLHHPFWEPLARELKARYGWKTIDDCEDEHGRFTFTSQPLRARDDALVRPSDLAIALSQSRYERLRRSHVNCILLSASDDEVSPSVWGRQFQNLIPAVHRLYGKASIIVVTWNNLDLTRQCLESVLADTTWPQYDVIVVDNASSDGSAEYLTVLAQNEPRLRVILNPANEGFATANNIGIRSVQDSEYVVLLNNDTVVPRGWLPRLLRHARKPEIGLVGPVTNWTGNEAKIDVTYTDLRAMESFAADYIAQHEGEVLDIRVLAMYCVALRKSVLDEVGPLDERFRVGMFEDDDYARRVRQVGYRVVCAEDVFVHHYGNASFSKLSAEEYQEIFARNKRLYEDKWGAPWVPHQNRADGKRR